MPPLGSSGCNHSSSDPDVISTNPVNIKAESDTPNHDVQKNTKDSNSKLVERPVKSNTWGKIYSFLDSWELLVMFLTIARESNLFFQIFS